MKCGFCGNELENGAQFCPNCGMIISLGDDNNTDDSQDKVVESVYNVFKSNIEKEKKQLEQNKQAQELAADPTEEKVEFVMSLPEFDDYVAQPINTEASEEQDTAEEITPAPEEPAETVSEELAEAAAEEPVEEAAEELQEADSDKAAEEYEIKDTAEEQQELPAMVFIPEETAEDIYSYTPQDVEAVSEPAEAEPEKEQPIDIRVPEVNMVYTQVKKDDKELQEKKAKAKENLEKLSPEAPKKKKAAPKKKKKGIDGIKIEAVLGIAIVVVIVLFGSAYAAKNIIPTLGKDETTTQGTSGADQQWTESRPEAFIDDEGNKIYEDEDGNYYYYDADGAVHAFVPSETTEEETTEEETTEEETTEEETTEEETTEKEVTEETTTKQTTTKETTTKQTTTKPTTTKPTTTKPTTTRPTTTRPTTTKPTTTKPTTTRPTTTKPTTTKPTTTDPYGINDVTVKKPTTLLSKKYTAYVTAEGVTLRCAPSSSAERVLYLSKGADVVVSAKEKGFCYIRSNRYGVYGWVSESYLSDTRPESESVVQSGTMSPDKKYSKVEIKYTTNGLNVRKGPGTSYDIVGLIPISYPVKVIGYKQGVSGWVYVQDTTYGYTGWVSTAYLK